MKKHVVFAAIFMVTTAMAFAQLADGITAQAWGRGVFSAIQIVSPYQKDGIRVTDPSDSRSETKYYMGSAATWGGPPRVDFRINGNGRFAGFTIQSNAEEGAFGTGDAGAQLWVQPFGDDRLRFTVGNQFMVDFLRGKVTADTGFENFLYNSDVIEFKEDIIFTRFAGGGQRDDNSSSWIRGKPVFMISSFPIQGLFLGLMLNGQGTNAGAAGGGDEMRNVLRNLHFGAGYEFPGIGHARLQWLGGYAGEEKEDDGSLKFHPYNEDEPGRIEVAFALTKVRGLTVDLGAKIWMPVTTPYEGTRYWHGVTIGLGAFYRLDDFSITAVFSANNLGAYTNANGREGDSKAGDPALLAFHVIPSYDFPFGAVGISAGMKLTTSGKDAEGVSDEKSTLELGVGAYFRKGIQNGSFKIGAALKLPNIDENGYTQGNLILTVPFIMEYAFF